VPVAPPAIQTPQPLQSAPSPEPAPVAAPTAVSSSVPALQPVEKPASNENESPASVTEPSVPPSSGDEPAPDTDVPPPNHQNISSDALDQSEVDRIAEELKHNLGQDPLPPIFNDPPPVALPAEEAAPTEEKTKKPVPLADADSNPEDTIVIDREGNLKHKADEEEK